MRRADRVVVVAEELMVSVDEVEAIVDQAKALGCSRFTAADAIAIGVQLLGVSGPRSDVHPAAEPGIAPELGRDSWRRWMRWP